MSGGLDSRLMAAAAKFSGADVLLTSGASSERQRRDYEVAEQIARQFGFPFGRNEPVQAGLGSERALEVYGAFHAGTYDRIGGTRTIPRHPNTIRVSGLGIGAGKGAWDWRPWPELACGGG